MISNIFAYLLTFYLVSSPTTRLALTFCIAHVRLYFFASLTKLWLELGFARTSVAMQKLNDKILLFHCIIRDVDRKIKQKE